MTSDNTTTENRISLGDPVLWLGAPLVSGGAFILHVHAGRRIVLCFLGSPANPRVKEELAALLNEASLFDRCIKSRQSPAGGATPFWRSSIRRLTTQSAKPNATLHEGETHYTGAGDRLIPEKAVLIG
jgi:hypothetical protein